MKTQLIKTNMLQPPSVSEAEQGLENQKKRKAHFDAAIARRQAESIKVHKPTATKKQQ